MILEVFFGANALDAIVKIAQIFVAFSEKLNFMYMPRNSNWMVTLVKHITLIHILKALDFKKRWLN